jgi:hypothetical protein
MKIKHDYSYLGVNADKLITMGYAEMSVHSLHFDRDLSEEEKQENRSQSEILTKEQWSERCDNFSKYLSTQLKSVAQYFADNYDVHQVDEKTSTMEHFRSDWDLYFYSNKGWNNKDYFDYFSIDFNEKRTAISIMALMVKITDVLAVMEIKNVSCRVQYSIKYNEEKLKEDAIKIVESIKGNFIKYSGMDGKFKLVNEHDGNKIYGFFPKCSKTKYYGINNINVILELSKAV